METSESRNERFDALIGTTCASWLMPSREYTLEGGSRVVDLGELRCRDTTSCPATILKLVSIETDEGRREGDDYCVFKFLLWAFLLSLVAWLLRLSYRMR